MGVSALPSLLFRIVEGDAAMTSVADTAVNAPYLTQADFLGVGFDITGRSAVPDSLLLPVVDPNRAGRKAFEFLDNTYSIPDYVSGGVDTDGRFIEDVGETREEIQNSFAANASVQVGYGAFSGQMQASYSKQYADSSSYWYAYRNFYLRLGSLSLLVGDAQAALSADFVKSYEALPNEVNDATLPDFERFFHDFGIYVTSRINLGASLEYYSAVSQSSQLSATDISAQVTAEYRGLFVSGAFSGEVTDTNKWQAYTENRVVQVMVSGGDPALVVELSNVDVASPSTTTADHYTLWAKSAEQTPAVADFSLVGVWDLIPDQAKSRLVEKAFTSLQGTMRPRLVIETSTGQGTPPTITLGGVIEPDPPAEHPIGFQLVVLDRTNASVDGVRFDKYYGVSETAYYDEYEAMYDQMLTDIEDGGFESSAFVMILASYGVSSNAPPTTEFYKQLRSCGGGAGLVNWVQAAVPGSVMLLHQAAYVLVGVGAIGPDHGAELYATSWMQERRVSLEVFFYRERGSKLYTLSVGRREGADEAPTWRDSPVRRDDVVSAAAIGHLVTR